MFSVLLRLLEQLQERPLALVALLQFGLELFVQALGCLEVVVEAVEVIDELLVVVHRDVRLHLFDVRNLLLVAVHLLLDLLYYTLVIGNLLFRFIRFFAWLIGSLSFLTLVQ